MTRKERMLAAVRGRPVDRTPFCTYNLHPCMDGPHRRDPSYRDLLDLVWQKAGMLCKASPRAVWPDATAERRTRTVEERDGHRIETTTLHTPKGDLRQVTVTPPGQPAMVTEHFIKTDEDIARCLSLPQEVPEYDPSPLFEFERQLEERGLLYVHYSDPMYAAAALFDFEDFAVRCLRRPETLRPLIEYRFEMIREEVRRKIQACGDLDVLFYVAGPEVATPPMLPPRVFEELVVPYHQRLIRILHDAGKPVALHCHGRVRKVLDLVMEAGFDALEPIEPPEQGDITLAELLPRCEGRLALIGHIQDQEFHTAPPGTLTRRVEEIARLVEGRTGYIMSPTCTPFQHPASETFLRNYAEWVEAAARLLGAP